MLPQVGETLPTRAQFSDEVNSVFRARSSDESPIDLTLVRLDEFVINDIQENFALLFKTGAELNAEQGVFDLAHDRLGKMSIFLVPIKRDSEGLYFEAVFNNLVK